MTIFRDATSKQVFSELPTVEQSGRRNMKVKCKLAQTGDVYLSTIPKLVTPKCHYIKCITMYHVFFLKDAKQKQFRKSSDNVHELDLSNEDDEFCGRVVYVIARVGVHGHIYPIKTDIEAKGGIVKSL